MRFLSVIFLFTSLSSFSQPINYFLSMPQPTTHEFIVEIEMNTGGKPSVSFVMPAWSPGRYTIQNFAKSVSDVEAISNGKKLNLTKTDKQTWKVDTKGITKFRLKYKVFANNLNGTFSVLDSDHANYNGPSLFMFADGMRNYPVNLTISPFGKWKIFNGYSENPNQTEFRFKSYDMMIDTPTEIGEFRVFEKMIKGKNVRIMIHDEDPDTTGTSEFIRKVYAVTEAQYNAMPEIDYEKYTFMIHFSTKPNTFSDGMEHFNSTQVIVRGSLKNPANSMTALGTVSHEHFHAWNVKRLRPEGVGPHNLTSELYTPSLWFSEGFTEYFEPVFMVRSKVISLEEFRRQFQSNISGFTSSEGRQKRNASESSMDTWFWYNSSYDNNFNANWYSYYSQGQTIATMMDLKIRKESNHKLSLEGFMGHMYKTFYEKEKGDWYYKGKPFKENDILTQLEKYTGKNWSSFWNRYVKGFDAFDASLLDDFGMKLTSDTTKKWNSGIYAVPNEKGFLRISTIRENSEAEKSGLQTGDIIISVNGNSTLEKSWDQMNDMIILNSAVRFELMRNQRLITISINAAQPQINTKLTITDSKNENLKKWLNL